MASFSTGKKNSTSVENNSNNRSSYIKRLLKNYLASADRSLSGPDRAERAAAKNSAASEMLQEDSPVSTEPASPVTSPTQTTFAPVKGTDPSSVVFRLPVFLAKDNSAACQRKADTIVRGQTVACFDVGGEKRICVPDLLNTVLRNVTIDDINVACDELCVHCSQCSDEQMAALKSAGVLPASTASAGLMTKSQAERLCHYLFEKKFGAGPPGLATHRLESSSAAPGLVFKVYHECFGKCKGIFYADRYVKPDAACIECCQCSCLMSPADFVCHGHKGQELRTCHWGFDSARWRAYLLVARDHRDDSEPLQAKLEELKCRFRDKELSGCGSAVLSPTSAPLTLTVNLKRKDVSENIPTTPVHKRVRLDSAPSSTTLTSDVLQLLVQQERSHHHHGNDIHTRRGWASHVQTPSQPIKLKREVTDRTEAAASGADHLSMPALAAGGRLSGSLGNVSNLNAQHQQQQQQQQAVSSNADRRQLVEMLRLITSGEDVPASTRQRLADAVLGLFDQRHHVISHLLQENGHLASKLQLAASLETKYRAALADLEGAEGLAALSSPRTATHAPTFTFPCTPDEASASAAATATC